MKKTLCHILVALSALHLTPAFCGEPLATSHLSLVDENRLVLRKGDVDYLLDSYIIPFQQPYYVHIKRKDGKAIPKDEAVRISTEYIQPRGCTEPLKRVEKLDKTNGDNTEWIIGVAC